MFMLLAEIAHEKGKVNMILRRQFIDSHCIHFPYSLPENIFPGLPENPFANSDGISKSIISFNWSASPHKPSVMQCISNQTLLTFRIPNFRNEE